MSNFLHPFVTCSFFFFLFIFSVSKKDMNRFKVCNKCSAKSNKFVGLRIDYCSFGSYSDGMALRGKLKSKYKQKISMAYLVDSLFDISMNFVVENLHLVESFVGFPSLVAEQIFKRFVLESSDTNSESSRNTLKQFIEAYGSLVLDRLNLSTNLIILNEYFESINIVSRYITELCLCKCFLGASHEVYCCISEFQCLKKLCLRDNSMTDTSIRLITLRMRVYGIGGKEIEYLDLADNYFTDDIVPWLSAFPKLNYLNISGSTIEVTSILALKGRYNLERVSIEGEHEKVINEGWATILLEKWCEEIAKLIQNKMEKREERPYLKNIVASRKLLQKPNKLVPSGISLVFKKVLSLETPSEQVSPPAKKPKLFTNCDAKSIEEDIFSGYK